MFTCKSWNLSKVVLFLQGGISCCPHPHIPQELFHSQEVYVQSRSSFHPLYKVEGFFHSMYFDLSNVYSTVSQ